ncbi:Cyclic pyranopterin monophosphate synthase accessory protein [Nymphaea thermarum]|nr:Cyclic pyranopterin monophosphate synthase accessory protein [Nymphaea thermarum]
MSSMILRRVTRATSSFYAPGRRLFSDNSLDHAIREFNKEMETIFGEPPPTSHGSLTSSLVLEDAEPAQSLSSPPLEVEPTLSHIGSSGEAQMVDVSAKESSKRTAIASCRVLLGEKAFKLVAANQIAKGDVLGVARIAGICAAKQTGNLIPLCHNITLSHVSVDTNLNQKDFAVEIEGQASSTGKTGVEMEAMTAVTVAGLTVYDMCKAASKEIRITDVQLESKTGGKTGDWHRKQ